jgi:aryl-alcohol dehydrogenase-like predicted oxidoreductase
MNGVEMTVKSYFKTSIEFYDTALSYSNKNSEDFIRIELLPFELHSFGRKC